MAAAALPLAAQANAAAGGDPGSAGGLSHSHTHAAGEIDETQGPVLIEITYTGEVMGNASGGRRKAARYLDNLDVVLEADLDAVTGWRGAELHLYGLYNNGTSISQLVGDAQAASNIETGTRALRLYEAWIDSQVFPWLSLRGGLYDLNSEFDALDAAGLFVGSAHGIGTDISQTGANGPSIFPSTSLALRAEVRPAGGWAIRAAALDGVPGDPDHPGRTVVRLGKGEGALLIGEVEAPLPGGGRLLLGHWRYTASFERLGGGSSRTNAGTYLRGELPVWERGSRRVDAFARLGTANGSINMFGRFASAGLKFTGWLPGRAEDEFGLAFASAFTSSDYRRAESAGRAETAVELTYRAPVTPWLSLQPNAQYVRRPNADPATADALVIGLRMAVGFRLGE